MGTGTMIREAHSPLAGGELTRVRAALAGPDVAVVAALTGLAAVLRFYAIGRQGFWFDEGNTALLVHFSPGAMLGLLPKSESTPPLYYCVAWVWARIFGYGEIGLRSLSATAGVLTVPIAYAAGAKLISRRAGVIAAALTACNPFLIWYSQEARSYSLLVAISGLTLLAFAHARTDPTPRKLSWWALAAALALATHYYALIVVLPPAVWLLISHRRRRAVQLAIGAVALCGLALIPLALAQNNTGHAGWIGRIPLRPRLGQIVPEFLIGFGAPAESVLEPLSAWLVIGALVLLILRSDPAQRAMALAVGAIAIGGLLLNLLLIAAGIDDLITRNVIVLWLPAAIVVAAGFGAQRAGWVGVAGALTVCAIGSVAVLGVATTRSLERPDWRLVARALGPGPAAPGPARSPRRAIFVQHYRELLPLSLYLPRLKFMPRRGATVSELDVVSFTAPRVRLCWWGAACNLSGTHIQRTYAIPGFHEIWRRRELQFTVVRLVSASPVRITPRLIARSLTTTRMRADELLIQR